MVLGIYGAGGLGREVLVLAQQINSAKDRWQEIIFLDDDGSKTELKGLRVMALKDAEEAFKPNQLEIVITVGEPAVRKILADKVNEAGFNLATLIHPSVFISESVKIGRGVIIGNCCQAPCDVVIEDNVYIQPFVHLGHDVAVGTHSVVSSFVQLSGSSRVGQRTYIGISSPVKESVTIGDDVIIGMSSAVTRDIPDNMVAVGNPARPIRENTTKRVFS